MRVLLSVCLLAVCLVFAGPGGDANARGAYAAWLKHNDAYRVTGNFAGYKGSLQVQLKWRGNRFVVDTPLGTFPLTPAGGGVTFRVKFENHWASITWLQSTVYVVWKGQKGVAQVQRINSRAVVQNRGNTLR